MAATKILRLRSGFTVNATGTLTSQPTLNDINGAKWVGYLSVGTITGTTPTLDVTIQHSADGTNWVTLCTFTQLTGASGNTAQHVFAAAATDYLRPLLPYVRVTHTAGGTLPVFNSLTVNLLLDN